MPRKRETYKEKVHRQRMDLLHDIFQYWNLLVIIILYLIGCRI